MLDRAPKSAERAERRRAQKRASYRRAVSHQVLVKAIVDEDGINFLVRYGYLAECRAADRDAIGAAVGSFIRFTAAADKS